MATLDEKKYMAALKEIVLQHALMVEEDFPDADRDEFELQLEAYIADAQNDIDNFVDEYLLSKFGE